MKKIDTLIASIQTPMAKYMVSGVVLAAIFQVPVIPKSMDSVLPVQTAHVAASQVENGRDMQLQAFSSVLSQQLQKHAIL